MTVQYDYLGHIPVNMFYKLKYYFNEKDEDSYFYVQQGVFRKFKRGNKLPLKTLYYKFPDNFYIMTYGQDLILLEIRNGTYTNILDIDKLEKIDLPVYDIWGNLTKAESVNDIKTIKIEYERFEENEITSDKFISLWLNRNNSEEDIIVFGRHLEIFRELYILDNEDYMRFKNIFKSFLEKQDILELKHRYIEWIENEELISYKDIDIIINKVLE